VDDKMRKKYKGFIAKSTIISLVAFSIGTGSAWADQAESQPATTVDVAATTSPTEIEKEAPTLIPGEFFYFVKTVYERIQLAFASDNTEEAILLTKFAQERLAESAVLLKAGESEKAKEILQLSLSQQQQAIDTAASVVDPTTTTPANTAAVDPAQADKMRISLQHNIVALTAALEKVKNPQAQRSLLKNITKSFAHLEKKLTKLSEKTEEVTASESELATEAVTSLQAGSVSNINEADPIKTVQKNEQKTKKEKEQRHTVEKQRDQSTKSKSHKNTGRSESAGRDQKKKQDK
jgi:hypothetical protein